MFGSVNPLVAAIPRRLHSDPLVLPAPAGTLYELGCYERTSGTLEYWINRGNYWFPWDYSTFNMSAFTPTIPGSPPWELWGSNVDGLGTGNASLTGGQLVTDWSNLGSAGGTAMQGNAALYKPTLLKLATTGRDAVVFDQDKNYLGLTGSATSLNFIHQTGVFDLVLVFRPDIQLFQYLLASTNSGSDKGFGIDLTASNTINVFVAATSTILNFTATQVFTQGTWWVLRIRGDGTKIYISQDGGAEQASSAFGAFTGGNMTRDAQLGQNPVGSPSNAGATVAFLAIWSTALTAPQWTALLADLQRYYKI